MPRSFAQLAMLITAIFLTSPAVAELHALHDVEQAAYVYAMHAAQAQYNQPQISVSSLDKRLRLQACEVPLDTFSNKDRATAGQMTIGVRCHAPVSWTVYVSAEVKVMRPVAVAARPLSANHVLSQKDVKIERRDIASLRQGYMAETSALTGLVIRHSMPVGAIFQQNHLRAQAIVKRGEQVTLIAGVGGMEVRVSGTSLADASIGQRVKVKNNTSERVVEGIVDAPGVVRINM